MTKKIVSINTVPTNVPKKNIIEAVAKKYSLPKLFIVKDNNGKPSVAPGKILCVYFYFRNPETKKFDSKSKFVLKFGINRFKTVAERKAFGKNIIEVYTDLLKSGYNPYTKEKPNTETLTVERLTTRQALTLTLNQKKKNLAKNTIADWEYRLKTFFLFAERQVFRLIINTNRLLCFVYFSNSNDAMVFSASDGLFYCTFDSHNEVLTHNAG